MCELKVILDNGESRDVVMESVTKMVVNGDDVDLYGILGEKKTVKGSIKEISFAAGEAIIIQK